jgi:hypothetical protein
MFFDEFETFSYICLSRLKLEEGKFFDDLFRKASANISQLLSTFFFSFESFSSLLLINVV